jgi:PadR family transcriptional regulator PadR
MRDQDFLRGFVKCYVLWRCSKPDAYGLKLLEEAADQGWRISAGTLYPMLATLLEERDVGVERRLIGGKWRKIYRLTGKGRRELIEVQERLVLLAKLLRR